MMNIEQESHLLTVEEMQSLLQGKEFAELTFNEETGLYSTDYFYTHDKPTLLKTHLIVEQLAAHSDDVDWAHITDYFNDEIIAAIKHAYHHPLVWLDESGLRARRIECVLEGKIAMESEHFTREDTDLSIFLEAELPEERIKWFIETQPKGGDENIQYAYDAPIDMLVWAYITTDFDEKELGETDAPVYLSTKAFGSNLELVNQLYGAEKVVELICQLREDWHDICVQKAFGMHELSEEQIEEFRYYIFQYLERNIQYLKKLSEHNKECAPQAEEQQPQANSVKKRFKYISLAARTSGFANDIEDKLKVASQGQAPELIKVLKQPDIAKHLDIDVYSTDIDVRQLYNDLNEHFGLKYKYPNFLKSWKNS